MAGSFGSKNCPSETERRGNTASRKFVVGINDALFILNLDPGDIGGFPGRCGSRRRMAIVLAVQECDIFIR
jgi:hypothetical protein